MLIATGRLSARSLRDSVVVVTGGGGGIGLEAARSLLWLGATVVIAEIDAASGRAAEKTLSSDRFVFVATDVADEKNVGSLAAEVEARYGRVDAVLNNATYSPAGQSVVETPIDHWDRSYAVNLRGPALLAKAFLPGMIARHHGVFACVSSTGGPYLAAYESLKAAQVELANSLDAELEGTGVIAFTIGPGLVPTATATRAVEVLAPRMGMTAKDLWAMNAGAVLSVEAAGAGFAAAIALADRYAGQEISSSQALVDAGIEIAPAESAAPFTAPAEEARARVVKTLREQYRGWQGRSFFERQWMLRDFKQRVGMPAERCLEMLAQTPDVATLRRLADFYAHMAQLAAGYVKNATEREAQVRLVNSWRQEVDELLGALAAPVAVH
ncbi:MAG TPA: SDR family oxidoreductase [Candidatus Dormibacteraeota bacterium]|nr:SDR family oxidoreductase [Candidatus Dormibacteraeota bacterium]